MVNAKVLGIMGVFLLVAGVWSLASMHSAEARGMPYCWLKSDGSIKLQYQGILKSTPLAAKFPVPTMKRDCHI